jgi:hypothetical protein
MMILLIEIATQDFLDLITVELPALKERVCEHVK